MSKKTQQQWCGVLLCTAICAPGALWVHYQLRTSPFINSWVCLAEPAVISENLLLVLASLLQVQCWKYTEKPLNSPSLQTSMGSHDEGVPSMWSHWNVRYVQSRCYSTETMLVSWTVGFIIQRKAVKMRPAVALRTLRTGTTSGFKCSLWPLTDGPCRCCGFFTIAVYVSKIKPFGSVHLAFLFSHY